MAKADQAAVQKELAQRILARRRLLPFVQRLKHDYLAGWVHEDICERLERFSEAVAKGESPRLMLLMPPRHGKSELASRFFPAWHLGRNPEHEIIACSYSLDLARTFSRRVQQAVQDPAFTTVFPDAVLDPNNKSAEEWGLAAKRGSYVAAGIGGGITGRGAHCLIIDDPLKSAAEADSATVRESVWDWYGSTAYTRLAPGGGVLIIQTWWHDDDLAGKIQQAMVNDPEADQFEVVKYPAIAENDEYYDEDTRAIVYDLPPVNGRLLRHKGDALHPARYDIVKLKRIRATIQPRHWSALFQQNPVPDDGIYFTREMFRREATPEVNHKSKTNIMIACDFAISENTVNDYTVLTVGVQDTEDVLHVAEMVRFRSKDGLYIVEAILNLAQRWYHPSLRIGVEDGQIWRALESLLKKRMRERKFYPAVEVLKPLTDKQARARPLQGRMQQGMVSFAAGAEWFETLRTELLRFPAGVHDDIVDSLAWLAQLCVGREPPRKEREAEKKSWKDKLNGSGAAGCSHMAA